MNCGPVCCALCACRSQKLCWCPVLMRGSSTGVAFSFPFFFSALQSCPQAFPQLSSVLYLGVLCVCVCCVSVYVHPHNQPPGSCSVGGVPLLLLLWLLSMHCCFACCCCQATVIQKLQCPCTKLCYGHHIGVKFMLEKHCMQSQSNIAL